MRDIYLSKREHRKLLECGFTITSEGIYHPDRVMHEFVLLYMLSGTWDIVVGKESISLNPGDIVLLPPRIRHYSMHPSSPDMKNMYIHFCPLQDDLIELSDSLRMPVQIHAAGDGTLESQFREIIHLFHNCYSVNRQFLLASRLEVLLASLSERVLVDEAKGENSPIVTEMIRLFIDNPDRFYSQTELAEHFGVSVRTLTSLFKKVTGTTLHAWQIDHKLSSINDILRYQPTRKLRDLAISYGFYDEFQLSKLYKKKYGFPPKFGRR